MKFEETDRQAFELFAKVYPHEAYEQRPSEFCEYVRKTCPNLTDEDIKELLIDTNN